MVDNLVRQRGLEPPHPYGHKNLNLTRLPIPPLPPFNLLSFSANYLASEFLLQQGLL
jgi:hypothetical protein